MVPARIAVTRSANVLPASGPVKSDAVITPDTSAKPHKPSTVAVEPSDAGVEVEDPEVDAGGAACVGSRSVRQASSSARNATGFGAAAVLGVLEPVVDEPWSPSCGVVGVVDPPPGTMAAQS